MNYYEQFYDDLEFEEEDDHYSRGKPPEQRPEPDHSEDWSHRDERYRPEEHHRGGHHKDFDRGGNDHRDFDRGPEMRDPDGWEQNVGRGGHRGRGRGQWQRGRGFEDKGRDFGDRGRCFGDRGRGRFARGRARGRGRGVPQMNFVKASDATAAVPYTVGDQMESSNEARQEPHPGAAVDVQPMPVLSSYGYGDGSEFGAISSSATTADAGVADATIASNSESQISGPGVPGEVQTIIPQQDPSTTQSVATSSAQPSKVVTAVVKPMYHFVKAGGEFKSTDVAFHETPAKQNNPAFFPPSQGKKHAGLGMAGPKSQLQSYDVGMAFNLNARDGCNPAFDAKFNHLREAIKVCSLPQKNSIEIIHMASDKVKMKISDINKPGGRTPSGQVMFSCRLEIDGVFVAEGCAANKKTAKHEAYNAGKALLEGGILTVRQTASEVFEVKVKDPFPTPVSSAQAVSAPKGGLNKVTGGAKPAGMAPNASYNKPQIVFHNTSHPGANKPLQFGRPGTTPNQQTVPPMQSSASAGELATKLLNFVKEGAMPAQSNKEGAGETNKQQNTPSQSPGFKKPATVASASAKKMMPQPNKNILKRAVDSAHSENLRVAKKMKGPLSLEDLSQFVIIDNSLMYPNLSDISILHASANHNRVVLKFEYEFCKEGYNCSTVLGVHLVATAQGASKELAKSEAAKEALKHLKEICYTVMVKQEVDTDAEGMTKDELVKGDQLKNQMIPDSNIGNMLLRKMGWAGGGVGKDGKGIQEPVKAERVINREGLGLQAEQGIGKDFQKHVTNMLTEYIKSDDQRDLHFSCELAKEERAVVHQTGQKLGLKTQSKGKGDNRYLIVSRKRSANQLLDHVMSSGGSTSKYDVIPPSNTDVDPRKREAISYGHGKQ